MNGSVEFGELEGYLSKGRLEREAGGQMGK